MPVPVPVSVPVPVPVPLLVLVMPRVAETSVCSAFRAVLVVEPTAVARFVPVMELAEAVEALLALDLAPLSAAPSQSVLLR